VPVELRVVVVACWGELEASCNYHTKRARPEGDVAGAGEQDTLNGHSKKLKMEIKLFL
jgi:hypothetical protein